MIVRDSIKKTEGSIRIVKIDYIMKNHTNFTHSTSVPSKPNKGTLQLINEKEVSFFHINISNYDGTQLINDVLQKKAVHFIFCAKRRFKIKFNDKKLGSLYCKPDSLSLVFSNDDIEKPFEFDYLNGQEISILSVTHEYFKEQIDSQITRLYDNCYFTNNEISGFVSNFYEGGELKASIQKIKNYIVSSNENNLILRAALYQLKFLYCEYFLIFMNECNLTESEIEKIKNIPETVKENLETPFTAETLANYLNINVQKLEHGSRKVFKCDLSDKINDIKMGEVYKLIKDHNVNLAQAAYQTGFTNRKDFYDTIRQKFNLEPHKLNKEVLLKLTADY